MPEIAHYLFKPIVWLSKIFDFDYLYHEAALGVEQQPNESIESGMYGYARFFYNLVPFIPFSSQLVTF